MAPSEKRTSCWLIDLAAPGPDEFDSKRIGAKNLSAWGQVAEATLRSFFSDPNAVSTVSAKLSDPTKPELGFDWFSESNLDELHRCVLELCDSQSNRCEILVVILPRELTGEFANALSENML